MRDGFANISASLRQTTDIRTRRIAFSAFEAGRRDLYAAIRGSDRIFYTLFLLGTALSPLFVVIIFSGPKRTVGWDIVAITSTIVLIGWTYGVYTFTMVVQFFSGILRVLNEILFVGISRESDAKQDSNTVDTESVVAFANLFLLIAGTVVSLFGVYTIFTLYDNASNGDAPHSALYNSTYCEFVGEIFVLSVIFILMDLCVAKYEKSHSDSFIGASSVVHCTLPMCVGIGVMGMYLIFEYCKSRYFLQMDWTRSMEALSTEFVSGALSFQMIIANVIFVFIKQNRIFRAVYSTIDSSVNS